MTKEEVLIAEIKDHLDSGAWKYDACYLNKEDLEVIVKALERSPKIEPCEGELKPCPFCGGKASYDTNGSTYWVICLGCGARSRITCFDRDKGRRALAEAWNRRV